MNRAIRQGYASVHPGVVLLPEEYTGANIFCGVGDLTYDAQVLFLQADLLASNARPEQWARSFQQFLHDQALTLPPGALKMRWISNHDTVSWTFQKQRPARAYGVERMRALWALCALIEGVPMVYQGDEDPAVYRGEGESSVEFLARLYGLRRRLAALPRGNGRLSIGPGNPWRFRVPAAEGLAAGISADQFQFERRGNRSLATAWCDWPCPGCLLWPARAMDHTATYPDESLSDAIAHGQVTTPGATGCTHGTQHRVLRSDGHFRTGKASGTQSRNHAMAGHWCVIP